MEKLEHICEKEDVMPEKDKETKPEEEEIQLISFRLRDEEFGVDIGSVKEISKGRDVTHIPEAPSFIQGVINLRGQIVAVIDLAKQFGLSPQEKRPETVKIIVTEVGDQTVGLLVDDVPKVVKINTKNVEPAPGFIQSEIRKDYIKGVGKLEDRIIILLDMEKVLAPNERTEVAKLSKVFEKEEG